VFLRLQSFRGPGGVFLPFWTLFEKGEKGQKRAPLPNLN